MTLVNTRTDFDFEVAAHPTMLQEMRAWVLGHRALYPHYRL
jgi:dTDP-4-dehydrorhamnose reductase